ncbi:MAG: cupin domain-containing protein [Deltaproteobacteria bacterium]|nr:cupin domain-containing protein [Deltaproteobacteria bacterium]
MSLLGPLTPAQFLAEHWQKKPLLVRQAIPGFRGFLKPADLLRLSTRDDVAARAVTDTGQKGARRFRLDEGPFKNTDVKRVPADRWTLLVQGIEQHFDAGWELLQRFNFLPNARVDDLMVSWARPGGSVGPHYDLYDVFLLQGTGRRRWQISTDGDLDCDDDADVRVLTRFKPSADWVLEPGDMLYLPPNVGHFGVAEALKDANDEDCMTWSIGFSAPTNEQLAHNFLAFLGMEAKGEGIYEDPDLTLQARPADVVDATVARVERALEELRWDRERVATFTGRLLTGPKDSVVFAEPKKPVDVDAFARRLAQPGTLKLARGSRMLFRGERVFLNGEEHPVKGAFKTAMQLLADTRATALPIKIDDDEAALLHGLYVRGFIVIA